MSDLFAPATMPSNAPTRRTDPDTSRDAAKAVQPAAADIAAQVLAFAKRKGREGFIDDDLLEAFPDGSPSSYRTRRSELTQRNHILNTRQRRENAGGRECVVWMHRDFDVNPPPILEERRATGPSSADLEEGRKIVRELDAWSREFRAMGHIGVAPRMEEMARVVERLVKA